MNVRWNAVLSLVGGMGNNPNNNMINLLYGYTIDQNGIVNFYFPSVVSDPNILRVSIHSKLRE